MPEPTLRRAMPRRLPARNRVSLACLLTLAALTAGGGLPGSAAPALAQAAAPAPTMAIDLPAQPLEAALHALSRQAGGTANAIAADARLLAGKTAPALQGRFTLRGALDRLLAGSGLSVVERGGVFVVQPAPPPNASETTLSTVTVTADAFRETATSPVNGFVARRSATATKTDTLLSETPQSVSVIPRAQIEAQAAKSLDQAFQYTAGIMPLAGGAVSSVSTGFTVRGFNITGAAPLYLNGTKFPINSLSGAMEPYAYERIELLKGPASILYGQAAPGGIINLVSKRPTDTPQREVELQLGSWGRTQVAADLSGPATEDGRIRYRLTGLARESDSMIKAIPDDRTSLNAALDWQLTDATTLTLLATYNQTKSLYDVGKPLEGSLLPNPGGRIARDMFMGEPGFDKFDIKGTTLGYLLEHRLNDHWTFRQNLLAYDHEADNAYATVAMRVDPATPRLATRYAVTRFDTDKGVSLDNQLHGKLSHGAWQHQLLFGLDWAKNDFTRTQGFGGFAPLDLFQPAYGAQPNIASIRDMAFGMKQMGVYLQDQIKYGDHWVAAIGGRYDEARDSAGPGSETEKSTAFTPRLGVMYLASNGWSPYYSYSESFQPASGTDVRGNRFKPTAGKQHEIGVKYEPTGANASVTLALFDITQRNMLTGDPANTGFLVQTGEVRSRGFEIEGRASLSQQLDLVAALSATDARVTRSNLGDEGSRPVSVPRNAASVWADYRLPMLPGLSAGLGVRHVGSQTVTGLPVPSYTVADAALRYDWQQWQFALNIKNLADKAYLAACPGACYFGDERNFTLTARYRW